jgi:hypothetical protein
LVLTDEFAAAAVIAVVEVTAAAEAAGAGAVVGSAKNFGAASAIVEYY